MTPPMMSVRQTISGNSSIPFLRKIHGQQTVSDDQIRGFIHHQDTVIREIAAAKVLGIQLGYIGWKAPGGEPRPVLMLEFLQSPSPRVRRAMFSQIAGNLNSETLPKDVFRRRDAVLALQEAHGIMDDNAKGVFNGKIFVRPYAQKTNAFHSNRNILISETATVNTKPQLEIWADDVKCSHGCTTGQLDEEAVFYLQSRGISYSTAKSMLLYAFAAEVMEPVKNETLKGYLDQLISERLHKDF